MKQLVHQYIYREHPEEKFKISEEYYPNSMNAEIHLVMSDNPEKEFYPLMESEKEIEV